MKPSELQISMMAKLLADEIDPLDSKKAEACLSECVAGTRLVENYRSWLFAHSVASDRPGAEDLSEEEFHALTREIMDKISAEATPEPKDAE
jgi:hypothetical protein